MKVSTVKIAQQTFAQRGVGIKSVINISSLINFNAEERERKSGAQNNKDVINYSG